AVPPLDTYAYRLWDYWERNLDPDLFRERSLSSSVGGKVVVITGASSGIGRDTAIQVGEAGAKVVLIARTREKLEEVADIIRERREGHIINISSYSVQMNTPRFAAYAASKQALDQFSRCIASEVVDDKVHITTIFMPLVRTAMIAPTGIYANFPALTPEEAAQK